MTLFLLVTALMNIGLGYGLAVYLGHAVWPGRVAAPVDIAGHDAETSIHDDHAAPLATPFVAAPQAAAPVAMAAPAAVAPTAPAPAAEPALAAVSATPPLAAAIAQAEPESAELEQDVLAGIEEFRNQLAQMKAQPGAAASPEEAAAAATV